MTEREAVSTLLLRNVALLVDGHLDLGTAAHRATVPQTVRALRQALDVLVAVSLDALLRDPGLARQRGGVGGVGIEARRRRVGARRCGGRGARAPRLRGGGRRGGWLGPLPRGGGAGARPRPGGFPRRAPGRRGGGAGVAAPP